MYLNTLAPALGSKKDKVRVGRGIGCTKGKTCGKGHKGQKARSGGGVRRGFEGGQMPLQQRLPKFGFTSRKSLISAEIRLHELEKANTDIIDLEALKKADVISKNIKFVKVISSGKITKSVTLKGIKATKGAKVAIEAAGGKLEEA